MKKLKVVGAVIENECGDILCALRSPSMSMPNLWEFPGGKIDEGEQEEDALIREIEEELNCTIKVGELIENIEHQYATTIVNLLTFKAIIIDGTPKPLEHAKLIWVKKSDLLNLHWAPADIPTVKRLLEDEK